MANISQIQAGAQKYLDAEFVNKMTGWQKWVFAAGATLFLQELPNKIETIKQNKVVQMLGVINEQGEVDVQKLYTALKVQAQKGPVTIETPLVGAVTLNAADVDKLYSLIINS